MAVGEFSPKDRYIKNSRLEVIDLQGETKNPIHTATISVTQVQQAVIISTGKKIMVLANTGENDCYYGGTGVTSATGIPIYSAGESITFMNVKNDFIVYVISATGEETTLRRVEF